MKSLITFMLCLAAHMAITFPSSGIVVDKKGNVYFTDSFHDNGTLWKVDDSGELEQVIGNFDAQGLQIDQHGNLWLSESVWLDGLLDGQMENTLIKITPDLDKETLINTRDQNIFNGSNIAVAPDGSIFFTDNNMVHQYIDNNSKKVLEHKFQLITFLAVDKNGTLWIADSKMNNGTLYYLKAGGTLKKYIENIMAEDTGYALYKEPEKQIITGAAFDGQGNIYISENIGCRIVKVDRYKQKTVFYQSPTLWAPSDVFFHNGNAYIKEIGFNKSYKGPRILIKDKVGTIKRLVNIQNLPEREIINAKNENFIIPPWVYFGLGLFTFSIVIIMAVRKQLSSEG